MFATQSEKKTNLTSGAVKKEIGQILKSLGLDYIWQFLGAQEKLGLHCLAGPAVSKTPGYRGKIILSYHHPSKCQWTNNTSEKKGNEGRKLN